MKNKLQTVSDLFKEKGLTLSSVESFTGGLFASRITSLSGASNFFKGGLVSYTNEIKNKVLGIDEELINTYGVVSKEIAAEMSKKGIELFNTDYSVSFTGNAGPSAMEDKPVGEVYISISTKYVTKVYAYHLSGDRNTIQEEGIRLALELLEKEF